MIDVLGYAQQLKKLEQQKYIWLRAIPKQNGHHMDAGKLFLLPQDNIDVGG